MHDQQYSIHLMPGQSAQLIVSIPERVPKKQTSLHSRLPFNQPPLRTTMNPRHPKTLLHASLPFLILTVLHAAEPTIPTNTPAPSTSSSSLPILSVTPDLNKLQKWDTMAGDTADPFWTDDDALYHFTCDGRGFGKESRNFVLNKLTGPDLAHLEGFLVNPMNDYGKADMHDPTGVSWKVTGQECIDGVFYTFVCRNFYGDKSKDPQKRQTSLHASLIKSTDHGLTWTPSAKANLDNPMWPGGRFGSPGFIHYGKNGGQVSYDHADKYVYAVSNNGFWNGGDDLILGRVARADLPKLQASDWSYYTGSDGNADSSWSKDISKAQKIIGRPSKLGWTAPVFIPSLNRYLLVSWYVTPTLHRWFNPDRVVYDFMEAEHPWGPWTFVSSLDDTFLMKDSHMYGANLCAKYQETTPEGVIVHLFTSGCPFKDIKTGLYKNWTFPLTVSTKLPAQTLTVNDTDPSIRYTGDWKLSPPHSYIPTSEKAEGKITDLNKDVHYNTQPGDSAEIGFEGTGIKLISEKFSDLGTLEVFLDGKSQGTISLKQDDFPRLSKIPVFSVQRLPSGKHTLKVVNLRNGTAVLDAFVITK